VTAAGIDVCAAAAKIATANSTYNSHKLHYWIGMQPDSNSYAYTMLLYAGLTAGWQPPNVPGWGYDVIKNSSGYN